MNQRTNGGQWNLLGAYPFSAGTEGYEMIGTAGTAGYVAADAMRFTQAIIVDINEGGTTIFGTRPQINAGATTEADTQTITDASLAKGAEISLDLDQVGTGTTGNGLTVQLMVRFNM